MIVQKQREEKKEKRTRTRLISDIHVTVTKNKEIDLVER
jgi:hypothetical protein